MPYHVSPAHMLEVLSSFSFSCFIRWKLLSFEEREKGFVPSMQHWLQAMDGCEGRVLCYATWMNFAPLQNMRSGQAT